MQGATRGHIEIRSITSDDGRQALATIGGRGFVGVFEDVCVRATHLVLMRRGDQYAFLAVSDEDHVPHQFKTWEVVWKR